MKQESLDVARWASIGIEGKTREQLLVEFEAARERIAELGRLPRPTEFEEFDQVRKVCGSAPEALRIFVEKLKERGGLMDGETAREIEKSL